MKKDSFRVGSWKWFALVRDDFLFDTRGIYKIQKLIFAKFFDAPPLLSYWLVMNYPGQNTWLEIKKRKLI